MFGTLTERFHTVFRRLSGQGRISEGNVREAMEEIRRALLEADVNQEVVEAFCAGVMEKALGREVLESLKPGQMMVKIVYDELVRIMGGGEDQPGILYVSPGPTVVMMCGLQGSGKTTTCAKLAAYLKKRGRSVMVAAGDLQRPAAVRQLEVLAKQVQEQVGGPGTVYFYAEPEQVAEYGRAVGAAVGVARRALEEARRRRCDVLVVDTAGRLHIDAELMGELRMVRDAIAPQQIFLVVDAMTGQDAVHSARAFNEQLELDGVILTKFDSDARGGAALSVRYVTGKPIKFLGTGERLEALEEFHAPRIASRILGMGDVISLVEKAQEQVSLEEAKRLQEKAAAGKLTMEDFLQQLRSLRKMGPMKQLLGLLPGVGSQLKELDLDERELDRVEAMICSMTPEERRNPGIIDASRRRRIARGSGTRPEDVSQLLKGFELVSELSKQMAGLGLLGRLKAMVGLGQMDLAALGGAGGIPRIKGAGVEKRPRFKERKKKSR